MLMKYLHAYSQHNLRNVIFELILISTLKKERDNLRYFSHVHTCMYKNPKRKNVLEEIRNN